jgi:hypothetical protein
MTGEEFIRGVVEILVDDSLTAKMLKDPPQLESDPMLDFASWHRGLDEADQARVLDLVREAERVAIFRLLTVIDGVLPIVDGQTGDFELHYVDGDRDDLLTDKSEPLLHDLFRARVDL